MEGVQSKNLSVNAYDIFANFLPGFVLIGGLYTPLVLIDLPLKFGLIEGGAALFLAFALGGFTQAIGTRTKYFAFRRPFGEFLDETAESFFLPFVAKRILPFNYRMRTIHNEGSADDSEIPITEELFPNCYSNAFNTNRYIEDWGYLFKMCLAYLENSPYNRTLRIQTQHLAARGLYIALFIISAYLFILFSVFAYTGAPSNLLIRPDWYLILLGFGSLASFFGSYIFYLRSVHFEHDVVTYMISEMMMASDYQDF